MEATSIAKARNTSRHTVDVVYVAVCGSDIRLARICIASVRRFYPNVPVRILQGGNISNSLLRELKRYYDVDVSEIPRGNYGWGFVKLEALFGKDGERFLILDSDTVITGPVFELWDNMDASFLVSPEKQPEDGIGNVYYDWEKVREIDGATSRPKFLFNTGQWFGTAGVVSREDFSAWVGWSFPRRLRSPGAFMNGEQGLQNFVFNRKVQLNQLRIGFSDFMVWPGQGMQGITAESVCDGTAPARIVHWAGMKKALHREMIGCDLLDFFEKYYYSRLHAGGIRIVYDRCKDVIINQCGRLIIQRLVLIYQYKIRRRF